MSRMNCSRLKKEPTGVICLESVSTNKGLKIPWFGCILLKRLPIFDSGRRTSHKWAKIPYADTGNQSRIGCQSTEVCACRSYAICDTGYRREYRSSSLMPSSLPENITG